MAKARGAASPTIIERLTPEVVFAWVPDDLVDAASEDVARGRVARPAIRSTAVEALVATGRGARVRVRISWGTRGPRSECECGARTSGACRHAAAVGLMLIGAAEPASAAAATVDVVERELAVRRERGGSELFAIGRPVGVVPYACYEVRSPSSRAYEVTLRALDAPHNSCTCPDLATNLLGTCKHVEAVLHKLRRSARSRFTSWVAAGPARSYVYVHFEHHAAAPRAELRMRLASGAGPAVRRLSSRFFDAAGRPLGTIDHARLLVEANELGIEVPPEAVARVDRDRARASARTRQKATETDVLRLGREQPGFRATLYPYQVDGVAFLASRGRVLLADDMGLGKTAQAICAMIRMMRTDDVRRVLVVCPASLKHQWVREIERFTELTGDAVRVVTGPREERHRLYADPPSVVVTSYELARADERDLVDFAPDLLVLDEAQRIKNWRTRTADAVKRIPSRFAFVLTGTPLENRLDDLYSILQVVDPHLFGPLWQFNEDFTELDERGKVFGYRNLDKLRVRIAPVVLRRRKEDVLSELPERIVNRVILPMTPEQASIHSEAEYNVGMLLSRLKKRPLTPAEERKLLQSFQRMRMACDAAGLVDGETQGAPKLDELERLLEEICVDGNHKVVVFSEWEKMQPMAAAICERLRLGHVRLHGGVPSGARGALIDKFRDDPKCAVFLSTDAGGVGLNLQVASHLINLDLPWNPAVLAQRIARVHRLGQKTAVNVVLLVSEGSFEQKLEATLDAKRALFAAAIGDDAETTSIGRSTLASRIATVMRADFAAETGAPTSEMSPAPPEPVALTRERLGADLERLVRLPDGRLLAVVRGEGTPSVNSLAIVVSHGAAVAMEALGPASPLASAEVLFRADPQSDDDRGRAQRKALLDRAERKLASARVLMSAGQLVEALGLLRDSLALGARASAVGGDPGDDSAALFAAVYARLVPDGSITKDDAHALARASELARAFDGSAAPPPPQLVDDVSADARDLLRRVAGTLG